MIKLRHKARMIGALLIGAIVVGVFSVAPAVDSTSFLAEAATQPNQVAIAALFQFSMALIYFAIAILLYPIVKPYGANLAINFLGLKIMAAILVVISTVFLISILDLSFEYVRFAPLDGAPFEAFGIVLKSTRDQINHVFMIIILCIGNIALFTLFIKSKLIPIWISFLGLVGAVLSIIASLLVLFRVFDIITVEYLVMNAPTALADVILGIWLMVKGFNVPVAIKNNYPA